MIQTPITLFDYTCLKKAILYCLVTNDGLGLLNSGIFQQFQLRHFGQPIKKMDSQDHPPKIIDQSLFNEKIDMYEGMIKQLREENSKQLVYFNRMRLYEQNPQLAEPMHPNIIKSRYEEYDLPLQMPDPDNSLHNMSEIMKPENPSQNLDIVCSSNQELQNIFHQTLAAHGYEYKQCSQMPLFSTLMNKIQKIMPTSDRHFDYDLPLMKRTEIEDRAESKREIQDRQKDFGKRELKLIIKEKAITQRKAQLEQAWSDFKEKQQFFKLEIRNKLSQIEQIRLDLDSRERKLIKREQQLGIREADLNEQMHNMSGSIIAYEEAMGSKNLDIWKERVKFEEARRHAVFNIEKENTVLYESILPNLQKLHRQMLKNLNK